jgi:hypothetical protein
MEPTNSPSPSSKSNAGTMGIVAAVIALIIGLGAGYGVGHSKGKDSAKDSNMSSMDMKMGSNSDKATALNTSLVSLGVEHMDLTNKAIDEALDGSAGANASKADLIKNGENISAAIGSVYGADAQKQFQDIWNLHLNDFVKYALASKGGDEAGKAAALKDIHDGYTVPISKLLSGANPNLPQATLESAFGEHIDMTAQMIDDHVKGDYTAEATVRQQADTHISGLMSTLASAIVKQYPDKF